MGNRGRMWRVRGLEWARTRRNLRRTGASCFRHLSDGLALLHCGSTRTSLRPPLYYVLTAVQSVHTYWAGIQKSLVLSEI